MKMLILLLVPIFDIFVHKFCYMFNKGLYVDVYIPKCDRDKIWEVIKDD